MSDVAENIEIDLGALAKQITVEHVGAPMKDVVAAVHAGLKLGVDSATTVGDHNLQVAIVAERVRCARMARAFSRQWSEEFRLGSNLGDEIAGEIERDPR